MAKDRPVYMGPRLRRLRRELGLTQADMAADLEISASYVALLERKQRPLTADMLLRLARTYKMDMSELAGDGGAEQKERLQAGRKEKRCADSDQIGRGSGGERGGKYVERPVGDDEVK